MPTKRFIRPAGTNGPAFHCPHTQGPESHSFALSTRKFYPIVLSNKSPTDMGKQHKQHFDPKKSAQLYSAGYGKLQNNMIYLRGQLFLGGVHYEQVQAI